MQPHSDIMFCRVFVEEAMEQWPPYFFLIPLPQVIAQEEMYFMYS